MPRVAIVTDSSADLAPDLAARAGITVVPVSIRLGAAAGGDRVPVGLADDARAGRSGPDADIPSDLTAAFASVFAALARTHEEIVAVLLSSRLGAVVEAAARARERVSGSTPVEIVDSRSASLGLGFQALRAAELAREGLGAAAISAALRGETERYHVVFSVESVEHLQRSGQIARSAAMIADALQLKPLLRIDEGQIVPYERARTRARAIAELAEFVRGLPAVERCAVLYASNRDDALYLTRTIAADTGLSPERLMTREIGPAVTDQVGPGAIGVAVVEADAR
jgi:DegV family protein with EDD domain